MLSKYTTEVRWICETFAPQTEDIDEDIKAKTDWSKMTPFDLVRLAYKFVFDEYVRGLYATTVKHEDILFKILYHYYTREIGFETFGLWKQKMNEFMLTHVYEYAELYKTIDTQYDMFDDVNWTRKIEGTDSTDGNGSGSTRSIVSGKQTGRFSDTPQGGLSGLEDNSYMSSASIADNSSDTANQYSNENRGTFRTDRTETLKGKTNSKSYATLVNEYRKAIMNVDMKIIDDVRDMFMNIW